MDTIGEVFEHWDEITSAKRLRGAILHGARVARRLGNDARADWFRGMADRCPKQLSKEAINTTLFSICNELGLIPQPQRQT